MADKTVQQVRIALLSKTASEWSTLNPTPLKGEFCHETDTNKVKVGDGVTAYNSLKYIVDMDEISGEMTCSGTATVTVGGVTAGTSIEGQSVVDIMEALLSPYVAPTVSATGAPNGGTFENGVTQTITQVTVRIVKGARNIELVELKNGQTSLGTKSSADLSTINALSQGQAGDIVFTGLSVAVSGVNTRLTAEVTDTEKVTSAQTGSFTWVYPFFYGATNNLASAVTSSEITAATKNVSAKGQKTFAFTTNDNRPFIAYPQSYGALSKITDSSGVTDYTNAFGTPSTVEVTSGDPSWGPVNYYVYVGQAATLQSFQFRFTF